ncbi:hypothetical protein Prudu_005139 [Prunus dulcis]|uniref:Uncharacterized protein n=1 Tax=Prunus dulcis TaxID=3755 RepID=A0A4Y1QWX7_PRUDU|nr:hypothetical protein Prudu_005139 [Prunus dulcis]
MQKPREDVAFAHASLSLAFNSPNTGGFLNTRKVFSENHNVPMDTHKVFTALVLSGSAPP